ncbi:MAG: PEGA domain-containing protein [Acidobacteriota bacterium]
MTRDDPAAFAPPPAFGPFRVLHQIGIGALGPVFRTYEPTRDRLVAVKVFRLDITPEQSQALAAELAVAADAGLFHPSIVEPVGAGVEGTVAYRAEEYVAADSLDVAIRQYAPASLSTALPFITQLAGAIDFARTAGVGHGALHLRDVFVTPDEARASGFGVVEALERIGIRAPVRRPYSAPERIAGESWGTPADVFSLAAIAFELLTARRPTGTGDQIGAFPAEMFGRYASAIHGVLARAMHDDPARRQQRALALASALGAAARGGHVSDAVHAFGAIAAATSTPRVVDVALTPASTLVEMRTVPGPSQPADEATPGAETPLERAVEADAVRQAGPAASLVIPATPAALDEPLTAAARANPLAPKRRRTAAPAVRQDAPADAISDPSAPHDVVGDAEVPARSLIARAPGGIPTTAPERQSGTDPAVVVPTGEGGPRVPGPRPPHGLEAQEDAAVDAEAAREPGPDDHDAPGALDVDLERDSDTAHHELLRREVEEMPQPMLFAEAEAAADLALHAGQSPHRFGESDLEGDDWQTAQIGQDAAGGSSNLSIDFDPPESTPEWKAVGAPATDPDVSVYGRPALARGEDLHGSSAERPRPATLPLAITLVFGLLVGFAAGYAVSDRGQALKTQTAALPANPAPATPGPAAAAGPNSGKAYSEQRVAQQPPQASAGARGDAPPRAAAAPAPRPAATSGRIVVTSAPSNVGVLLNGKWRGRTPLTIDSLKFGDYAVRVVQPGLTSGRQDVRVTAGEPVRTVAFKLERTAVSPPPAAAKPAPRAPAPRAPAAGAATAVRGYLGSIYVDSRPSGAKVTIDGRAMGTTPARIPEIGIGSHVVKLELADHRPWTASARVSAGTETRVTGSLERIP